MTDVPPPAPPYVPAGPQAVSDAARPPFPAAGAPAAAPVGAPHPYGQQYAYPAAPQHPYAAPYVAPYGTGQPTFGAPAPTRRSTAGIVAFVLGVIACIVVPIIGSVAAFAIGAGADIASLGGFDGSSIPWEILSPVRDQVLLGEVAFWVGTVCGTWALVQGVVAIVRGTGRGWAIAAVVLAVLGPVVFFTLFPIMVGAGTAEALTAYI